MTTDYIIDASSIINLLNADALRTVCHLRKCRLWLTPMVVGECGPTHAAELLALQQEGLCNFVDEIDVPAELFLELLAEHELGDGETESIAVCRSNGFALCCDDRKARQLGGRILGEENVAGSLRLLRHCVEERLLECVEAFRLFNVMREQGGFLPDTSKDHFCAGIGGC